MTIFLQVQIPYINLVTVLQLAASCNHAATLQSDFNHCVGIGFFLMLYLSLKD